MYTINQEILQIVANNRDSNRTNRQVANESVQVLKDCGFFKIVLPKQWGGRECTPQQFFTDQIELAEADMSTAWIVRHHCGARLPDCTDG